VVYSILLFKSHPCVSCREREGLRGGGGDGVYKAGGSGWGGVGQCLGDSFAPDVLRRLNAVGG